MNDKYFRCIKYSRTLIAVLITISTVLFAQSARIDSLKNALAETRNDSLKIELLYQLAIDVGDFSREKAIGHAKKALTLIPNGKYQKRKALTLNTIGYYYWEEGKFYDAIDYYQQALAIAKTINDDLLIARISNNLGAIHWGMGNFNEALDLYQIALNIRIQEGYKRGMSLISNNIGLIYQEWDLFDKAFEYHNRALQWANEINDLFAIAYSYNNIGRCYEFNNNISEALKYYQLSFEKYSEYGRDNSAISLSLKNIGDIYNKMNEPEQALDYYQKSLSYGVKADNQFRIAIAEYNIGKIFLHKNQTENAREFVEKSLAISEQNGYNGLIRDNLFLLSEIAKRDGDTAKAFQFFRTASAVKDSIFNAEKIAKFTDLQIKYHSDQQTKENVLLRKNNEIYRLQLIQQKNIRNALIVGVVFILLILGIIFYSRISIKKINRQLEESEAKYRLMIESSQDAVIIVKDNKFLFFNNSFSQMLGYDEDSIYDKTIKDMTTDLSYKKLQDLMRKHFSGQDISSRQEIELKRKDGSILYVEANITEIDYNDSRAFYAIIRDITKQKEIIRTLQLSEKQSKGLKEFIPICAGCNKIRDEEDPEHPWVSPSDYITERLPDVKFSHGMCPDCISKWYPDYHKNKKNK